MYVTIEINACQVLVTFQGSLQPIGFVSYDECRQADSQTTKCYSRSRYNGSFFSAFAEPLKLCTVEF